MRPGTRRSTLRGAVRAVVLALAALFSPVPVLAQAAGGPPPGGATGGSGGKLFLAWIVLIIAIAVVASLITGRRGRSAGGRRP